MLRDEPGHGLRQGAALFTADLPAVAYTRAQVQALERRAISEYGIAGLELMQRAGTAAFAVIQTHYPACRSLLVLCGAGNNAGDGYIVARLAAAAGQAVKVIALTPPDSLKGAAREAAALYCQEGGAQLEVAPDTAAAIHADAFIAADLLVDALLGTGLARTVTGACRRLIEQINQAPAPVLSLDLPSGLHADSGAILGVAVQASHTISFVGVKQGLLTAAGPDCSGRLLFADLQLPAARYRQLPATRLCLKDTMRRCYLAPRAQSSHKGRHGHVLIIGGDYGYLGAACLAATAAARAGAGLVSVATRKQHAHNLALQRPELMSIAADDAAAMQAALARADCIVIGPGLGQSDWAVRLLALALQSTRPLVLDADALNLLALGEGGAANLPAGLPAGWVLTPHPGEAARLLHTDTATIQQDRFQAIAALQRSYGGTVVLKGAGSLVKGAGDTVYICTAGNPGMGSGGMGDVLSGLIGGLLVQMRDGDQDKGQGEDERVTSAVCLAVYVHAAAGDAAAVAGERGLLASDLFPHIRRLVNV